MSIKYDYKIDMSEDNSAGTLILRRIKQGSRVLEFGPAFGYMTRYMKEQLGCTVYCVEIDAEVAEIAKQYAEKMIVADLDLLEWGKELSDGSFDYLIFADVLEHLKDPWTVLEYAVRFLKKNGIVITSIPNIGHSAILMNLLQGNFDYKSLGLLDNTHLRFFTRRSVLNLLDKAGLCPVEFLSTELLPENTEFQKSYADFPDPIQHALKSKEDAHVYQFVMVSKRKGEISLEKACVNGKALYEFSNAYLQVFWAEKGQFVEEHSVKVPLLQGTGFFDYEVRLPGEANGYLRVDPTNFPAYVELRSIKLFDLPADPEKVQLLANWSAENDFVGLELGSDTQKLESREHCRLIFDSTDPQIMLLNSSCPGNNNPKLVRLTMAVTQNLNDVLRQEIHRMQNVVTDTREEIRRQAEELEQTKVKLIDKQQELDRIILSRLWGVVNLLRRAVWKVRKLLLPIIVLIRGSYEQVLLPSARIRPLPEGDSGVWEATAKDPQFLLKGPWPKGWTEISWLAASDFPLRMRLYFDRGRGFNEVESLDLAVVNGDKLTQYKVIVPVGNDLQGVRLDPGESAGSFTLREFKMAGLSRSGILLRAIRRFFKKQGLSYDSMSYFVRQTGGIMLREGPRGWWKWSKMMIMPSQDYELWLKYNVLTEKDKQRIVRHVQELHYKPVFSIIIPVYNVDEKWLRICLDSVLAQLYPYWELCIADDASPNPRVREVLEEYAAKDNRIKVVYREKNGHISAASNSAIELATGEYIALLDNDDELTLDALYENAVLLNNNPDADMIYSDEDKISEAGERHSPFFKPDWSPDNMLSQMYTCHLGVYRTEIVRDIGGFRLGFEGSQDHDLVLRFTEKTGNICHIPKILYHWRTIAQSTAMNPDSKGYAVIAGEKAVQEALDRRGEGGWVEALTQYPGHYLVHYKTKGDPLISILIPTRDMPKMLGPCLESIFAKTTYANYEVIVIDNGSIQQETLELFEKWQGKEPHRFKVLRLDIPFNYSKLNNEAVKIAKGELILLLNNDIEVITPNWLEEMAGQAMRSSVGAVGAKLLFPDNTIQHSGVTLGVRGVADHTHRELDANNPGYFGRLVIVTNYSAVTGACLMVKKELFEAVGGLEEQLQVAFNDVDFCLKLLNKGYRNVLLPQVKLYHHESKSRGYEDTPEKMQRFLGEVNLMKERWDGLLFRDPCYNPNLTLKNNDFSVEIPDS